MILGLWGLVLFFTFDAKGGKRVCLITYFCDNLSGMAEAVYF